MTDLLRVCDLHVSIALPELTIEAVRGVSFRVRQGATVALVGESGAGKSIAAQAITGLLPRGGKVTGGKILFRDPAGGGFEDLAGHDPNGERMRSIRGRRISMVFQEPMSSFSPLHTIGDQISEAFTIHHDHGDAAAETRALLARVGFPDPESAYDAYPFELSGGLRQRAMIAMALICRPALVIADEPTTALDVTTQAQILKLICDLQRSFGMAVLLITHDLGIVANLAEEVVVLYRGEVVEAGARNDIFGDPRHPYLKALLSAAPRIGLSPGLRLKPVHEAAPPPCGPAPAPRPKRPPAVAPRPLLELRALQKSFRQRAGFLWRRNDRVVTAVDGVSLTVHRGETLGLVGESGSGKTTLAKLVMRAMPPDSGEIRFHYGDRAVDALTLDRDGLADYRRRVQYIFQDPFSALDPRMTVQDIITEPLEIHRVGTRRSRVDEARDLMRLVGLDPRFLNRYPHSFSGGQRQRVGIARALALRPELLMCDEPVSALDVGIQAQILNLLRDLQATLGLTYIFVSHNLAVVDYLADRIAVMCRGRIVELAPRQTLFESPLHPYTQQLLAVVPDARRTRPLDFAALDDLPGADPEAWREPFRDDGTRPHHLHEFAVGHFVRAAADASHAELRP